MRKTKIVCAGLFSVLSFSANAENTYVTIEQDNGVWTSYLLADAPKFTYTNDSLMVSGNVSATYPLSTIINYHFADTDESEVPLLKKDETRISYYDNQNVKVEGLEANTTVSLFNASGMLQKEVKVNADGTAEMAMPQQAGIYLLKVNTQTLKLIKK